MWRSEGDPRRAAATVLAVMLGLGGCAFAPQAAPPAAADPLRQDWAGRFSVILESPAPEARRDAAAGRFALAARGPRDARALWLELVSPFGQTLASGRREPDGRSTLILSDGRRLEADSLDGLLRSALGWPLPIERLADWLDDRFETVLARDAGGGVRLAEDSGWRIEREPRRWTLQRPHEGARVLIVLVLDR
jgi:outer membrane biogenesis lipoprotein LolB